MGARLGSWSPNYARSVQLAPDERAPRYEVPRTGDLVFHLLPKSLQLNPLLEMTVKTTFTPYGRKIPPATPERPVYYAMQSAGFRALGEAVGGLRPPPAERLERVARQALAYNGYVPADEAHPASLAVMLTWGAYHSPMARGIYSEIPADFSNLQSDSAAARRISQVLVGGGTSYRSRDREKYSALTDQAQGDLYFVLASAYDGAELARGNRRLVWRTYMTVGATGISMNESLGPLIASAGPYLGREMNEPEFTSHSISRVGTVEIGPSKIIESDVKIEARGAGRPLDQKP